MFYQEVKSNFQIFQLVQGISFMGLSVAIKVAIAMVFQIKDDVSLYP